MLRFLLTLIAIHSILCAQTVTATLNTDSVYIINPMIYGFNQDHSSPNSEENWGSRRLGGNRMSVFNWENGASNSGADNVNFTNDNRIPSLVNVLWADKDKTGEAYRKFHQDNLNANVESIITVPLMGWAAADKDGSNLTTPPSNRWVYVQPKKHSSFSLTPNINDDSIFVDESINWLINEFGTANSSTGIKYIALDNEPGLWNHTHSHAAPQSFYLSDYISKVIETAKAIKAVDPAVKLIAGEFTGTRIIKFNDATDWNTETAGYPDFPSYFLDKLNQASQAEGLQLIDYISFHFYPQHKIDENGNFSSGGVRVKDSESTDDHIRSARLNFTRSLWDEGYIEPSWLTNSANKLNGESHKILKRLQNAIQNYYPEIGIMIGEWDYGFDLDISHGLSTIDAIGAFGQYKVQIANRWNTSSGHANAYTTAAFKFFRNYDDALSNYGDSAIFCEFNHPETGSVWASKNSNNNNLHIILINKSLNTTTDYIVKLNQENMVVESIWGIDESTNDIQPVVSANAQVITDTLFVTLPKLTAFHIVLTEDQITTSKPISDQRDRLKQTGENTYEIVGHSNNASWTLFNAEGTLIHQSHSTINLNQYPTGIYILKYKNSSWKLVKM